MPENQVHEEVELITTFLNVNNSNKPASKSTNFLKTITARVFGNVQSSNSYLLDIESEGFAAITDVFDLKQGRIVQEKLSEFRTMSASRYRQYATYEQMAEDPIISSALDMYADDATQTDASGDRIWVTGETEQDEKVITNIFESLNIKKKVWKVARSLAQYGDVYLELIYDNQDTSEVTLLESIKNYKPEYTNNLLEVDNLVHTKSKGHVISDVRVIPDIQNMFDLQLHGRTVAFARVIETDSNYSTLNGYISPKLGASDVRYYPPDKFIHIYLDQSDRRDMEYYTVDLADGKLFRFEIARGKSMIHDVFRTHRDLQLLEYSIMLNRAARSSIFRFVQVEVGNMSKANVDVTMRKVKNLIESKITMNTNDNTYKPYSDPGPVENYLYIPVKNGQGHISVDTVGGDVNLRDIADLEYYLNKLFAGLKIPKSFLNYEEAGTSIFNSGGALTKQDARYARTVKRLQSFIIDGIKALLDQFLDNKGLSKYKDNYEVKMVTPSTVEDEERAALFNNQIELIKSLTDAISGLAGTGAVEIDMEKYIDYLSEEILDDPFLKDIMKFVPNAMANEMPEMGGGGFEGPEGGMGGGGGMPAGGEEGENIPNTTAPEMNTSPEEPVGDQYGGEWSDLNIS